MTVQKTFPPGHVYTAPPGDVFNEPNTDTCHCDSCLGKTLAVPVSDAKRPVDEGEWTGRRLKERLEEGDPTKC